eukprot:m.10007 g.10007  ORF g.10007 m.10007 type:complete len:100 (-) comp5521_c0_seq1:27-326(-)
MTTIFFPLNGDYFCCLLLLALLSLHLCVCCASLNAAGSHKHMSFLFPILQTQYSFACSHSLYFVFRCSSFRFSSLLLCFNFIPFVLIVCSCCLPLLVRA